MVDLSWIPDTKDFSLCNKCWQCSLCVDKKNLDQNENADISIQSVRTEREKCIRYCMFSSAKIIYGCVVNGSRKFCCSQCIPNFAYPNPIQQSALPANNVSSTSSSSSSSSSSSNIAPVIEEVLLEVDEYKTQISDIEKLKGLEETALLNSRQENKKLQKEILTKQKRFKDNEAADLVREANILKWKNTLLEKNLKLKKKIHLDEEKLKELTEDKEMLDKEMLDMEAEKQKHILAIEEKMKKIKEKREKKLEEIKKLSRMEL